MANPAVTLGIAVSIKNTPQAKDDLFAAAASGFVIFDVMANDSAGNAKSLYSLDDGNNSLTDLLTRDTARSEAASTDRSAHGAGVWITSDGKVAYDATTLDAAFQAQLAALAPGQTLTDTFTYAIQMGNGTLSWATVTVQLSGSGVNHAPVITSAEQVRNVTEDAVQTASGQVTATDADAADHQHYSVQGSAAGVYGSISVDVATGHWTYTLRNGDANVQALAANEFHDESFTIRVTDDHGAFAEQQVKVTVHGSNDGPFVTSGAQSGGVQEDVTVLVRGQVSASDVDNGDHQHYAVIGGGNGAFGSLSVDATTGEWTYTLRNDDGNVQALAAGQHHDEVFTVSVTDDHGASVQQQVTVTVYGTVDAPLLSVQDAAGNEDTAIPLQIASVLADTDGSENLSLTIRGVPLGASLNHGTAQSDGSWTLSAGDLSDLTLTPPPNSSAPINLEITATATGNDTTSATAVNTLHVTLNAVNDAPVNTVPGPQSVLEETALVFSVANGNRISVGDDHHDRRPWQLRPRRDAELQRQRADCGECGERCAGELVAGSAEHE